MLKNLFKEPYNGMIYNNRAKYIQRARDSPNHDPEAG